MIQTKTVDITPMKITLPVIEMSQYDLGRQVIVHMKDGSDWFDLTGYTAKLQGTKPSGFGYTVDGVVDGHDITFASSYDMTSEAGFIPSEVRLTKNGVSLGSLNLILHVEKTPHDVTVTDGSPETIIPEMTELVERAEAAAEVLLDCSAIATTLPAGSNATASYDVDNGVFHFGIPRGNKGETGDTGATGNGIASITKTGTSGLVDTYTITYTNGATATFTVTNGQNGTGSVADVWQNGVSVLDGTTAKVTVPTYVPVTDNEPYLFRQSGNGLDIHNREHDTLVGGSVAWNQLQKNTLSRTNGGITFAFSNGALTVSGTATDYAYWLYNSNDLRWDFYANHKYLFVAGNESFSGSTSTYYFVINNVAQTKPATIINYGSTSKLDNVQFVVATGQTVSLTFKPQLFDLTQMLGSTIADAIYAMEQATAGSGVAFFKKLFPNDYYAYNAGELKHVSGVSAHVMRDANNNIVGSYPLDSSLTLRGIPKLSNGKLYYDGDVYEPDGTVTRKYGIVTFNGSASETWRKEGASWNTHGVNVYYFEFSNSADNAYFISDNDINNAISTKWTIASVIQARTTDKENIMTFTRATGAASAKYIEITSTASDVTAWKAVLQSNPVTVVYELATPTTEAAEPYTNPQVVDEYGTEEYVSTSIVPVGHQTEYPDLFSGDYNDLVNKPTIPTETSQLTNDSDFIIDASYVHTDNNFTTTLKDKLDGIASGAEVNVQSNWNETDSTADAYIANKPDIDSLKVLVVTLSAFSSLPATFYETAVTADHVCIKAELGTPSAQTGDWTVTTSAGELNISGSISGSTTATLYLARKEN